MGMGYILISPPWEGYDEIAHLSLASQIKDEGEVPPRSEAWLDARAEALLRKGPSPYQTRIPLDRPIGQSTYAEWFAQSRFGPSCYAGAKDAETGHVHDEHNYQRGDLRNWQAQHPPGYYMLLAAVLDLAPWTGVHSQLMLTRCLSWTLSWIGILIGIAATIRIASRIGESERSATVAIGCAYPLLWPGFIPEFARAGNDSIVVVCVSLVWALLLWRPIAQLSWFSVTASGLVLGFGALCKVTLLPVSAGVVVWLLVLAIASRNQGRKLFFVGASALTASIVAAISGFWYVGNIFQTGSVTGLQELTAAQVDGAEVARSTPVLMAEILRGIAGIALTFAWGGSTSGAYPPAFLVLLLLLPLGILFIYACKLPQPALKFAECQLALLMIVPVVLSLVYYAFVVIIARQGVGAPGWYIHTLVAPLCLVLGIGLTNWRNAMPKSRFAEKTCFFFAIIFTVGIHLLQLSLFAGITRKTAASNKYISSQWLDVLNLPLIYERISTLSHPFIAVLFYLLGVIVIVASLKRSARHA
jgi:hypothetical protein